MEVMVMANAQPGVSNFQRNGVFATNCCPKSLPLSGFSIFRRPIFGVGLNEKNVKRNRVFGIKFVNSRTVISAVSKEGSDILEKEFEFKPSFDQYLKVMGTVRLRSDRDRQQRSKEENPKHSVRSRGVSRRLLSEGSEEDAKLGEPEGNLNREKASKFENRYESLGNRNGSTHESERVKGFKDEYDSRQNNKDEKDKKMIRGETRDGRWSKYTGRVEPGLDFKGKSTTVRNAKDGPGVTGRLEQEVDFKGKSTMARNARDGPRVYKSRDKAVERGKFGVRNEDGVERNHSNADKATDRGFVPRSVTKSGRDFPKRFNEKSLEVERAAFQNFDEFGDIMDKPRVSQMEMEQRIQKLAKWLNGADIDMPEWMFSKMMRSAQIRFTDHSILRVIQLLGKLGNWRRVLQVIEWLQMRERFKSHKLRYIYTTALDVLGKARRPVEALNVFHAMLEQMSSYPDLVAYHSIAVTLGQVGHMRELFDVIDTMRSPPKKKFKTGALGKWDPRLEPDIVVFHAVLNACVQRKQWEGAFWVLQQLKQQGLQPATTTYGLVMEVMLACGKYNLVHEFFKKVQKSSIPNALTYRVIVNTLWREGKIDEAVLVVHNMEKRGIVGYAALYYDFARCLCSDGRCQEALMQIEKICKVANKPLVVTYTGLIQACLDAGSVENAAYVFKQMENFCSPNLVTCNIMLKAYLDHRMFEKAKDLFLRMLDDGNNITNGSDYKVRIIPDSYTFNTLLDACVTEKRWDDFEYVYKRMLHHGFHFNAKRHLRMILDACKAGRAELLDMTWMHLTEADRIPPPPLVKEQFCTKLEKDDYAAALSCITTQNLGELQAFSKTAWLKLFKENAERFQNDTFVRLVDEGSILVNRSDRSNPVFQNLMAACGEVDRIRLAGAAGSTRETVSTTQTEPAINSKMYFPA
ncbi:hypothetical protein ACFX10_036195 [Malus domestica]